MTTFDAMTPVTTSSLPPAWERKIAFRWRELEPFVLIRLRGDRDLLPAFQSQHRSWLASLLRLDIEMRVVRRLGLDDIRLDEATLSTRRDLHLKQSHHPRYTQRRRPNADRQRTSPEQAAARG